jgi:hypothetical protein
MIDAYFSDSSHTDRRERLHGRVNGYDEDTALLASPNTGKTTTPTKILLIKASISTLAKSPSYFHAGFNLGVSSSLPNTD